MITKRIILTIILLLSILLSPTLFAKPNLKPDYRSVRWGMTMTEVKKVETATLYAVDEYSMAYVGTTCLSLPCTLTYSFTENKLDNIRVSFDSIKDIKTLVLHCNRLYDTLTKKYGPPTNSRYLPITIKNRLPRDVQGNINILAHWYLQRTEILLQFSIYDHGPFSFPIYNHETCLIITYTCWGQ